MLFDTPNPLEQNPELKYDYNLISKTFDLNNQPQVNPTYDQFISLRDTFIDSKKKYPGKRGAILIVGDRERSIEIKYKNRFKVSFEPPSTQAPGTITIDGEWPYVESDNTYWPLGVIIKEDGRYRIVMKTQVLTKPNTEQVYAYCDYYPINDDGTYPSEWIPIAVYDLKGKFSKTFTGSISGTCHGEWWGSVTWSCTVNVNFKLGDILQSITTFWYNERDCKRGDKMVFKAVDENDQPLDLQAYSNYFSVEYLELNKNE